jgi:hypothetical protein
MKKFIFLFLFFSCVNATGIFAQQDFSYIDFKVKNIDAPKPDSLARLLTKDYFLELDKVRAIYSWVAQNISYNTGIFSFSRNQRTLPLLEHDEDTAVNWASANEMTAIRVMKKRIAICDGYAKLFQTLCDYAGIRSEIIIGYARSGYARESKFRTNHSWNAVMIDGKWHLLDVTWGSGYVNYGNQFIHQMDEKYFLSDPATFFLDHDPEDLSWTLLTDPPASSEYRRSPYRLKNFIKYNITSHFPEKGIIEASEGDTIRIVLSVRDLQKAASISPDPFFDSAYFSRGGHAAFVQPAKKMANSIEYNFIAPPTEVQWLYILFNDDVVLRYRLNIKRQFALSNMASQSP